MIPSKRSALRLTLVTIVLFAIGGTPASGADVDWIVRANATQLMPDVSYRTATSDGYPIEVDSSSDTGWGLGVELLATPKLGIGLQYVKASPTISVELDGSPEYPILEARDDLGVTMYTASLNLHLTSDRAVDVWVSPVLAYMSFSDLHFSIDVPDGPSDSIALKVKRDLAWGVGMGVDIPFGESGWMATASATYFDSTLKFTQVDEPESDTFSFDPVVVSAGIGYKF